MTLSAFQVNQRIELLNDWFFRQAGTNDWFPAVVPGCNFTDLLRNNLIADPMKADHEKSLQWIESEDWEYKKEFLLTENQLKYAQIRLMAEGLDTFATIYVNGVHLAHSQNMFVPLLIDCKELLIAGINRIEIYFQSPINRVKPKQLRAGMIYPAENDKSSDKLSVFVRKAPCHFGWDWGPRFVTSGIWRPIALELSRSGRIDDIQFHQHFLSDETANFSLSLTGHCFTQGEYYLHIRCEQAPELSQVILVELTEGDWSYELDLTLANPQRWWPNGLGDAFLYNFECGLYNSEILLSERSLSVGLRTLDVVNEEDSDGQCFYVKVNGLPVFMKGANYIPSNAFVAEVTEEHLKKEFSAVKKANMNMLRVWGGGVYQSDEFYKLADQAGILIWQDFMFACSLYPATPEFLDNVKVEARANILRLRNHPCIALWCGNNEVDMAIAHWDWPTKFGYSEQQFEQLKDDYIRLFDQCLPTEVAALDAGRFYLRSSPIGFWEDNKDNIGNQHYWGVWHGELPFTEYQRRVPRFMTEFGFQSFPLLQSIEKFLPQEEHNIDSTMLNVHQKHPRGNKLIRQYMIPEYQSPKNFASLLYLSQVQQALGLKMAFEAHRDAMPFCMGTLYWQLNDTWPSASWSGIDYYGKWKALHYQAARCFKPQCLIFSQQENGLCLSVVSDSRHPLSVSVELTLLGFSGEVHWSNTQDIYLEPQKRQLILQDLNSVPVISHANSCFYARLMDKDTGNLLAENIHYFLPCRELNLLATSPIITTNIAKGSMSVTVNSPYLLRQVYIDIPNVDENFSDNFFDLLPNQTKAVQIDLPNYTQDQIVILSKEVRCISIVDTYSTEAHV